MVNIDIITGFLGAGKTTLIRKILTACEAANEKVVLIENEFGEIGIDAEVIQRDGFSVVEITQGCICCTLKNDFAVTLADILDKIKPDRVIFEPSGIFVPDEILDMLRIPDFAAKCRLNSLIAVVDSVNFLKQNSKYGFFFEKQTAHANLLMLSKVQFVEPDTLDKLVQQLGSMNPHAEIIAENWDNLDIPAIRQLLDPLVRETLQELIAEEHSTACSCRDHHSHPSHPFHSDNPSSIHDRFDTVGFDVPGAFTRSELADALNLLGWEESGEVLRGKGSVPYIENGSIRRSFLEFSYVNEQYSIQEIPKASGKVCFIGRRLNKERLKRLFSGQDSRPKP